MSSKLTQNFAQKQLQPFTIRVLLVTDNVLRARETAGFLVERQINCLLLAADDSLADHISRHHFDCLLLDLSVYGDQMVRWMGEWRKLLKKEAIVVTSESGDHERMVNLLLAGADDFMVRPLQYPELAARILALVRRKYLDNHHEIVYRELVVNLLSRAASIGGLPVALTKSEYDILVLLLVNRHRLISKEEFAQRLTGQADIYLYNFEVLYTHLKNLKRKLKALGPVIDMVYGRGYRIKEQ